MRLIANGTQIGSFPTPAAASGTPGWGNNATPGPGVTPTIWDADTANIMLAELMSILTAAGVTPDNTGVNVAQVLAALRLLGLKNRLLGSATYYVNPGSGSDGNPGTLFAPFASPQGAWNYLVTQVDLNNQAVSVDCAAGTYAPFLCAGRPVGYGPNSSITFLGNTGTPSSCVVSAATGDCVFVQGGATVVLLGFKFTAASTSGGGGYAIAAAPGGSVSFDNCEFNTCAGGHIIEAGGTVRWLGTSYTISGSAPSHWEGIGGGSLSISGGTIGLTGTPAFSNAFAYLHGPSLFEVFGLTFTGSATGARYSVAANGVIHTASGTPTTYLPGSAAGSTSSGGQLI